MQAEAEVNMKTKFCDSEIHTNHQAISYNDRIQV